MSTLFAFYVPNVNAPGGLNLVLTSLPSRIQEGTSRGVRLVLNATNASSLTAYTISWSVTDSSGTTTTSTNSTTTTLTGTSFVIFTRYPAAFGGTINLAGIYNVTASATPFLGTPVVTTGQFQVGLTDNTTYQRTAPVLVEASGYLSLDNVTINLTQGSNPVPGFPTSKKADTNGLISFTWQTLVGTALGSYLLTMSGASTPPKTPADSQTFTVTPTNVTISGIWLDKSSVERSQTIEFRFNATYLNSSPVISGTATVQIAEPNGTIQTITASYDPSLKTFRGFYASTLGSATGVWTGTINVDSFDDGFDNGGPLSPVITNFSIQTASLTVTPATYNATYTQGKIIPIYAEITTPSGATFTQGTVSATITSFGQKIAGPLALTYNASSTEWSGGYKINSTDPSGTWKMAIAASDGYGNAGQNSTSLFVSTPTPPLGPQNPPPPQQFSVFSSWIFWLLVLALVALGFGILIFKRRGAFHREVKIDVQAIKHQADQVKGDDFLQSIQAQLKRRTERMAAEKEKEKHD